MPENFNLHSLPTTDEEAKEALRCLSGDEVLGPCLVGIFQCHRAKGQSLLDAYEATLLAFVGELQKVMKGA